MKPRHFSIDALFVNFKYFRYGFFILLVAVPIATKVFRQDLSSLYIVILIFLGFGFSETSKLGLFIICTFVVFIRSFVDRWH